MENVKEYDLVIVGAGPAGLEAGLQAKAVGLRAILIDREEAGAIISNTMSGKKFYHAYGRNLEAPMGLLDFPDKLTGGELVARWRKQAGTLDYCPNTVLLKIEDSDDGRYLVRASSGIFHVKYIILATGIFSHPLTLGISGERDNKFVKYELDYSEIPVDKKILVVGGGNSAMETTLESALDNEVMLLVRRGEVAPTVTEKNRSELDTDIKNGKVKLFFNSTLELLEGNEATMRIGEEVKKEKFDIIYIHIGYEKPSKWLESLGIALIETGMPKLSLELETSRPGIFIAGALSGSDSIVHSANQSVGIVKALTLR
ncbi:MAG: NAD(P)/FAD-dependent oxidoreductase [Patescibacteria group bacterium]